MLTLVYWLLVKLLKSASKMCDGRVTTRANSGKFNGEMVYFERTLVKCEIGTEYVE